MAILAKLKDEFSFIRGNILINIVTLTIILVTAAIPYTYYLKYIEGPGGNPYIVGVIGFAFGDSIYFMFNLNSFQSARADQKRSVKTLRLFSCCQTSLEKINSVFLAI